MDVMIWFICLFLTFSMVSAVHRQVVQEIKRDINDRSRKDYRFHLLK